MGGGGGEKKGKKKTKKKTGGGGGSEGSQKDWAELYGVSNRSQMTSHCNGNHSKTSISLSV